MKYVYNRDVLSDKIFDFIYSGSLHDAVLQRAFKGKKDWIGNVENAKKYLREYIDCIINNKFSSQSDHDVSFIKTANNLCNAINSNRPPVAEDVFSFGNAQKLINIAVKHTYSICYCAPEFRENFRYCHCPLDSVMLNEVWSRYKKSAGTDKRKENLKNAEFFCQSWGNEGQAGDVQPEICDFPERYIKFQNAIREIIGEGDLYPIEFDYMIWK
ncbi:MAG: hypothetical protein E7523_09355 [Ruminococcaceae bacterium]|nr:hypothetical protein [Oscillospiraceae bacterium]